MWEACDRALAYNHDDDYDDADREALTASIPPLEPPMPPTKLRTVAQKDAERLRDKLRKAKQRKNIKEKASRKAAAASLADSLSAPPLLDSISAATAAALSDEETTVKPDLSTKEGRSEYTATDNSKDEDWEVMTIKERTLYTNNLHNERTTALRRAVEEAAALKRAVQEANNTKARSIADTEDNDKYILMIVLPTVTRVSTAEVFKSLKDITPVGCVLPADFATAITKTGWRSMQTTPVDQFGQWRHIGLGRDSSQSPFLLRCSVAHASSQGIVASTP
jgi:hypothetical protein